MGAAPRAISGAAGKRHEYGVAKSGARAKLTGFKA